MLYSKKPSVMGTDNTNSEGKILVPVDYSEYSIKACRFAAIIAKKSNKTIHLFHAFYSPAFDLIELTGGVQTQQQLRADVTEKLIEGEIKEMEKFIKNLLNYNEFSGIDETRITQEVKAGLAKDEILDVAEEVRPDIVVMGTRGTNKKSSSFLGSITETAINKIKVPVLAIPDNYLFSGDEKFNRIVYLTDFDESDFLSIKKLMDFTCMFNMSIHCIHIGPKSDKWETLKMDGLKDYFQNAYKEENVQCHILEKEPDLLHSLDKYVSENDVDIISLTARKRSLLKKVFSRSVAKKVFYHSTIPLLVFHS